MGCILQWQGLVERVLFPVCRRPHPWPAIARVETTISCRVMDSQSQRSPRTMPLRRRRCHVRFYSDTVVIAIQTVIYCIYCVTTV